ncbi:hypothetical protein [Saccharibacillus alkalitolerans]|uniref:Tat pathway signal sequence domain protein n=1 Tax=Saccharibacillus alkalitolerans TaxID=2705290 RepID=A0ABX0F6E9_9BACL|nr:hypothetical protein [Saccharibacillus alkalitolerans]NGZ75970.1 hypothetical protein [Saccharibacillus alkalitolerans]
MEEKQRIALPFPEAQGKRVNRRRLLAAALGVILLTGGTAGLPGAQAYAQTQQAAATIDTAKLKSISRLSFPMRDEKGKLYTVYIFSNREKKSVTSEDEAWSGAQKGDVVYSGAYRAALAKQGEKSGKVQSVRLSLESVNTARRDSFRLAGDGKSRPDLLFLGEPGGSNADFVYPYVITNGTLHSLDFSDAKGAKRSKEGVAAPYQGIRGLGGGRIQTRVYSNTDIRYYFSTYKLDLATLTLRHVDDCYRYSGDWPSTAGARSYLASLMGSAKKHVLPSDPRIKIGMTWAQVRSLLGDSRKKRSDEWFEYVGYGKSWIGYDNTLDAGSRLPSTPVEALAFDLGTNENDWYLMPEQVREWLGTPTEEYDNPAEEGHIISYHCPGGSITFEYEEEGSPIDRVTIY